MMQRREYLLSARYIALQLVANLWRQFVPITFNGTSKPLHLLPLCLYVQQMPAY